MKGIFARIKFNFRIILGIVFLVSTIFCFFFYFSAKASINKQVNYQGKLTNSNNWAVADGNYDMVFKIYDAVSGGSLLWTGTHTAANGNPVTSSAGVFSVLLGSGSGNTLNLDFSNSSNYYLQIEIYNSGTSSWETFSPRRPVASVPQAYNANNVIGDGRIDVTTNSSSNVSLKVTQSGTADVAQFFDGATQVMTVRDGGNVGIGTTNPASKLEVAGTLTVSGSNLTSLGGNLTVTGTAWTATPTISGLITATSGLTANGALTANNTFTLGDNGDTGSVNTSDWDISTTGAMTGIGAITMDGLLTGTAGATISGAAINMNASSNFATNIGTGTSTGAVSIGGGSNTVAIDSSAWDISTAGAISGVTTLGMSGVLTSTLATGTAPLSVTSTTLNTNLNADYLDGQHGSYYAPAGNISGTTNYVSKFTGTGSIGNSQIFDNGTNVGIGTTAPVQKLQVSGNTNLFGSVQTRGNISVNALGSNNDGKVIELVADNSGVSQIFSNSWATEGPLALGTASNISNQLFLATTGNVGIGTTAPTEKLEVSGNILASGDIAINGGDITSTTTLTINPTGNLNFQSSSYYINESGQLTVATDETINGIDINAGAISDVTSLTVDNVIIDGTNIGHTSDTDLMNLASGVLTINGTADINGAVDQDVSVADYASNIYNSNATTGGGLYIRSDGSGNLLTLNSNGTDIVTITPTQTTFNNPVSMTSAGDVSMNYDLYFNNTTASYIKFQGNGYIQTESPTDNINLYLSAANSGRVIASDQLTVQNSANSVDAYQFLNAAGTSVLSVDTTNGRVGIGVTNPDGKFNVALPADTNNTFLKSSAGDNLLRVQTFVTTNRMQLLAGLQNGGGTPQYSFLNDTDTGMSNVQETANTLNFVTGATERVRITSTGNVGIGTTDPTYKLDVTGTGRFTGALTVGGALTVTGDLLPSANDTYSLGSDTMRWANAWLGAETIHVGTADADEGEIGYTTSTNVMTVQSNGNLALQAGGGNVGIGTTNPANGHLQVQGTTTGQQIYSVSSATTGTNYGIDAEASGSGATLNIGGYFAATGGTSNYGIQIPASNPAAGTNNYSIYSASQAQSYFAGNVGIGTTAPSAKLHVAGNIYVPTQAIGSESYGINIGTYGTISETASGLAYITGNALSASKTANNQIVKTAADPGQFQRMQYNKGITFHTNLTGVAGTEYSVDTNERMRIDLSGNIGINTTGPDRKIDVLDASNPQLRLTHTDGTVYTDLQTTSAGNLYINPSGGNVGIGTTAPASNLHVYSGSNTLLTVDSPVGAYAQLSFATSGTNNWTLRRPPSSTDLRFYDGSNDRITFQNGGNVGIGLTNPSEKLEVSGNAKLSGDIAVNGGDITSTTTLTINPTGNLNFQSSSYYINESGQLTVATDETINGIDINAGAISDVTSLTVDNVIIDGTNIGHTSDTDLLNLASGILTINGTADINGAVDQDVSVADYASNIYNSNATTGGGLYIRSDGSGNLLTLNSNGTDIVTITPTQTTFNNPVSMTSAGDVSMNYDLYFNNPTASYIKYQGPGYIQTESPSENYNLYLQAANSGNVVVLDTSVFQNSSNAVNAYQFNNAAGTSVMSVDTTNGRVGIGTTAPASKLEVAGTLTVSGSNLTSLGGDLTVTGTAWTATPTISGLITATSGLTANGALTANNTFTLGDNGDTGSVNTSDWDISTTGAMTGIGAITMDGLLTGTAGATISGAAINMNASSNFATNIGTGTSTGAVSIGGGSNTVAIDSSAWDISTAGAISGVTTLGMSGVLTSTLATGTAPLSVTSTTLNTNLNADYLDGQHGSYYAPAGNISGTTNYVSKFTGTGSIGNSQIFDNGTNVGIGTTAPNTKLYVSGSSNNTLTLQSNNTAGTSLLITNSTNSANYEFAVTGTGNGYGSGHFLFWDGVNSRGPLILNANGNVRVGHDAGYTATAASNLSIYGNLAVGASYVGNAAPTSGMIVQGNTGIGTTNPASKLEVAGTLTVSGSNLTSLGGNLTVTGTAWTATPTISGLITATSGLTANGALTANNTFTLGDNGDTGSINTSDWDISTTGAMTGIGAITMDGLLTGTAGATISGAAINMNASSNFATNIGTGTSTGAVSIGGGSNTVAIDSSVWDISTAGAISGVTTITTSGAITSGGYKNLTNDNLLYNGDFETNSSMGWSGVTSITTGGYSGNYTSQLTGQASLASDDYIPVDPTRDVIQLEAYVKKTVAGTTPGSLYFGYYAYDANKTIISTAPCGTYCYFAANAYAIPVDSNWHKVSATSTGEGTTYPNFPVGTKFIRVLGLVNWGGSADAVTQIDHISLKKINNGPLFVGNNFSSTNMNDQYQATQLYTTSGNNFIISPPSSGNVGIGTTAPDAKLEVNGGGAAVLAHIQSGADSIATRLALTEIDNYGMYFEYDGSANVGYMGMANNVAPSGAWSKRLQMSRDGTEVAFMAGNVGIGTTNPTSQLDVASSASSVIQVRTTDTTGDTPAVRVGQSNNYYGELFYDSTGDYLGLRSVNNGTPNSGIYFPYASGNVGIGTTDPGAYKLNVSGTTYLGGATTVAGNLIPSANDTYDLGSDTARWANIWLGAETLHVGTADADEGEIGYTTATNVMTVQSNGNLALQASSGNVGIGTTAPAKTLNVAGTGEIIRVDGLSGANDQVISIKNNSQTADTSTNIFFADRFGASSYASSYIRGTGSGTSYLSFATGGTNFTNIYDAGAPTEKMRITAGGNIGIGTNNPTNKLHVEGTGGGSAGIYLNSAVPSATSNTLYNNGGSLYWNGSAVGGGSSQWTTQGTSIYYNTGNVGIGSTAPNNLFEVGDNALGAQTGKGVFVSNSSGNSHFDLGQGTSNRGRLLWLYNATAASAYLALGVAGGTNNLVLQDAGGNVGIGTTAPGQKVDVSGGSVRTDNQLISTVATGTAPLAVSSTTAVSNLNADMIDGQHSSAFATADALVKFSAVRYYTSGTNTWSKPAGLSYIVVETWGGGGGGGRSYYSGGSGGTSSFGSFLSATGGGGGAASPGAGGSGSGGDINFSGSAGSGGYGGYSPKGGSGAFGAYSAGQSNPGGGGNGAWTCDENNNCYYDGMGGGGGGYSQEKIFASSLSSSHTATVGSGGSSSYGSAGASGGIAVYEYTTVTSGTDLAENYPVKDPTISAGEIVTFDSVNPIGVKRAEQGDKAPMAGIIATKPGLVLSDDQKNATGQRPVALAGRVPTKVNLEGGEIKIGDRIAISSVPGVGRKANSLEPSVGVALEGYTGGDQMITVSIDLNPGVDVQELKNQIFETDMNNGDERSKENQQILSYGLNELMLMTPKQYTQISTFLQNGTLVQDRNKTQETFGFIAQELYQLIPQAVKKPKEGSDGLWEIDYSKIVPIVVKSIQEQQNEINNQKLKVESLNTEVASQKLQVESINTRLATIEASNNAQATTLAQLEQRLAELETEESLMDSANPENTLDTESSELGGTDPKLSLSDQLQGEVIANLNISNLTVIENVIVAGDIKVEGHIVVGEDTAGEAVVPTGENKVRIEFKKPYIGQPIVTATLSGGKNLFYSVKNVDTFGFDIIIDGVLRNTETGMKLIEGEEIKTVDFGEAIKFNWQAMEKGSTE